MTCDFRVHANGETLTTEPITFVLQSQEGLLELGDGPLAEEQGKKVLEVLSEVRGRKSEGFSKLVRQLSSPTESNR